MQAYTQECTTERMSNQREMPFSHKHAEEKQRKWKCKTIGQGFHKSQVFNINVYMWQCRVCS